MIVQITESQLKKILRMQINEGARKGEYKEKWSEEEQLLAFYSAKFNLGKLVVNTKEIADIIGTSEDSFKKQTANFHHLLGRPGLDRPSKTQNIVFEKYDGFTEKELTEICKDIIKEFAGDEHRKNDFQRRTLGVQIGDLRDKEKESREKALKNLGLGHRKLTLIGTTKYDPKNKKDELDAIEVIKELGLEPTEESIALVKEMIASGWKLDDRNKKNNINESLSSVLREIKQNRRKNRLKR
jgi:hypothetical protein